MSQAKTAAGMRVSLRAMFMDLQEQMMAKLTANRSHFLHPTSKGGATGQNWIGIFRNHD